MGRHAVPADDVAIRAAQRGVPLTEVYGPGRHRRRRPRAEARRPADRSLDDAEAVAAAAEDNTLEVETPPLEPGDRAAVLAVFTELFEGLYAHLPLKRAMYAIDPVQRLRLLARRAPDLDDAAFNYELTRIVTGLRDAHTRYAGPGGLAGHAAMLPFMVESYGAPPDVHYVVSNVATDPELIDDEHFVPGVELVWWNAVPIDRAVDLYAEYETGGRPDSRRARALGSLTLRALQYEPPPDEHWVVIGYRNERGTEREVRIPWRIVEPKRAATAAPERGERALRMAVDPAGEVSRRVKKLLFAPTLWLADHEARAARASTAVPEAPHAGDWLATEFQDAVSAKEVETPSGRFGYLRLWSFDVDDDGAYVAEVTRLLGLLPDAGLIIDLRANPGGLIWAAERALQLFGPRPIEPTRFSLVASELTRAMAGASQNETELAPWRDSLDEAVATGEPYSQAVPITPPERCNDVGQVYGGPVVAVVDANTYSAGDLFAAGFYDNELGILVTVGEATGAGGANVWTPESVARALAGTEFEHPPLPAGIAYTMAVRRATRGAGQADGSAIEDVGVRGHRTYAMTKTDLLAENADLLAFCGELLAGQPSTGLRVEAPDPGATSVVVTARGLDRLDVYVDGHPESSLAIADGETTIELAAGWTRLELRGFAEEQLRQRRLLSS